jgi:glycerol kinase
LLYNIKTKDWDDHILEKFGIPRSILPTVQDSASHFGDFLYQGLNIPITGVAGDQQAALCGQACFEKGMAKNTYGTGCFMLMHVGSEFVKSNHGLLTTLCCDKDGKAAYALEGSIFMAGASVQWLRDGLGIIASSGETEQLAKRVEGDTSVVVVPAFAGLGAPYWSMESKGALFGLTRDTTKAHLVKATLESMAFRTKDVLEAMEKDSSTALKILRVDGGACRNNYLMQFQADILDVEVERPQNVETTAIGVAYLAGITLDFWDTAAFDSYRKVDQAFSPSMAVGMREKLYKRWLNAVESTIAFGA